MKYLEVIAGQKFIGSVGRSVRLERHSVSSRLVAFTATKPEEAEFVILTDGEKGDNIRVAPISNVEAVRLEVTEPVLAGQDLILVGKGVKAGAFRPRPNEPGEYDVIARAEEDADAGEMPLARAPRSPALRVVIKSTKKADDKPAPGPQDPSKDTAPTEGASP